MRADDVVRAQLDSRDVFFVGGTTRIPIARKMIHESPNGKEPNRSIAFGAPVQVVTPTSKGSSQVQDFFVGVGDSWGCDTVDISEQIKQ